MNINTWECTWCSVDLIQAGADWKDFFYFEYTSQTTLLQLDQICNAKQIGWTINKYVLN